MKRSELKQIIKEIINEEYKVDPKDRQKMIAFMQELSKLEKKFQCRVAVTGYDGEIGVVTKEGAEIGLSQDSHNFGSYGEVSYEPTFDIRPLIS